MNKTVLITILSLLTYISSFSQNSNRLWNDVELNYPSMITVKNGRPLNLDFQEIKKILDQAPLENISQGFNSSFEIEIPLPNGEYEKFYIHRTKLMADDLALKYPEIKTFAGYSLETNLKSIVLDYTYQGFHAMVTGLNESIFIDPYTLNNTSKYISYYSEDFYNSNSLDYIEYDVVYPEKKGIKLTNNFASKGTGDELLTYRLAMATTGEYSNYHGGTASNVLSAVQTTIARVNSVYERELSVRLELISNTDTLFNYNSGTDPYSNNNGGAMLSENQAQVDALIGNTNYDIGHVFSTGGGGIASYASVCGTNRKAQGVTGSFAPVGDPFDIDYVAHEIGHQFSGSHTFDGTGGSCGGGNRSSTTAYEPGSGSTIMAYAGICGGSNLQNNSDDFFHIGSHMEMGNFIHNGSGGTCAVKTSTGNNAPSVNADPENEDYFIPILTAFELFGEGSDPDGDDLTFIWEQYDRTGASSNVNDPGPNSPTFRSWTPEIEGSHRVFPRLSNLLNNNTAKGEKLPYSDRVLTFRLTARDNRTGGGGVEWDEIFVDVTEEAGPFLVNYPDSTGDVLEANDFNQILWDVAGTDTSDVNCSMVDIFLSIDNGNNFNIQLANDVPNIGYYPFVMADSLVGQNNCRIKIKGVDNIFFDVSNRKFPIVAYDGVDNPRGLFEIKNVNINLYPNPTNNILNITCNEKIETISIKNLLGQYVNFKTLTDNRIDLSRVQSGIYVAEITLENGVTINKQLIKN